MKEFAACLVNTTSFKERLSGYMKGIKAMDRPRKPKVPRHSLGFLLLSTVFIMCCKKFFMHNNPKLFQYHNTYQGCVLKIYDDAHGIKQNAQNNQNPILLCPFTVFFSMFVFALNLQ
jgi:hypothetical protein